MRRAVVIVTIGLEAKLRIKQRFVRIACQWTEERKLDAPGVAQTALLESSPGGCDDDRDLARSGTCGEFKIDQSNPKRF